MCKNKTNQTNKGPDYWSINKRWSLCAAGRLQSPVDIRTEQLVYDPTLAKLRLAYLPNPIAASQYRQPQSLLRAASSADIAAFLSSTDTLVLSPDSGADNISATQVSYVTPLTVQLLLLASIVRRQFVCASVCLFVCLSVTVGGGAAAAAAAYCSCREKKLSPRAPLVPP